MTRASSPHSAAMTAPTIEALVRQLVREAVQEAFRNQTAADSLQPRNSADRYLSVAKAANVADVAPGTIRAWIRSGRLEARRAGRVLRVSRAELERFMAGEPGKTQRAETQRRAAQLLGRRS